MQHFFSPFFMGEMNLTFDTVKAAFELECFINGADNEALVRF